MSAALPTIAIPPGQLLFHISRIAYAGTAPYFGRNNNRYDDPDQRFGVLYLGTDFPTALMESMFHQHQWASGARVVHERDVATALVREIGVLERLRLLNLNAPGTMAGRFGLDLHQLTSRDYVHTRQLARLVHAQDDIDGIFYPSRNNYPGTCFALFDRCKDSLGLVADIPLVNHRRWPDFVADYAIDVLRSD